MSENAKRYKTLIISPELLLELFHSGFHPPHGYEVIADAVPPDAKLVNVQHGVKHGWPSGIEILIESAHFEEVNEGADIPTLSPVIRSLVNQTSSPSAAWVARANTSHLR